MKLTRAAIPDVFLLEPKFFPDDRGFFYESFNQRDWLKTTGLDVNFVQDNHSRSQRNVLRGLHYQIRHSQGKLVRCIVGEIYDVAVDLRRGSPFFGRWVGTRLSAENRIQMWVPKGFAHGFLVLSEAAEVLYKTTDFYDPSGERCVLWNDPQLAVEWPLTETPILSAKDAAGSLLEAAETFP